MIQQILHHQHYNNKNKNNTNEVLLAKDTMGMSALHILVCNPAATADLIEKVMHLDPAMATMSNMYGVTPIDLFLQLIGILDPKLLQHRTTSSKMSCCFEDYLQAGISFNDFEKIMILDRSLIEPTLLEKITLVVKAAASKECDLEVVYNLMRRSVDQI